MPDTDHLSLHVPEPEVRPGGKPDFSKVEIPEAGSVRRPPEDSQPEDIRDLAYSMTAMPSVPGPVRSATTSCAKGFVT
jgi:2-oxoisovalerate dehydrogenase E1 component alpha subunit